MGKAKSTNEDTLRRVKRWLATHCATEMTAATGVDFDITVAKAHQLTARTRISTHDLRQAGVLTYRSHMQGGSVVGDGYTVHMWALAHIDLETESPEKPPVTSGKSNRQPSGALR